MMKTKQQTFATVTSPTAAGDEPSILISTISLDRDGDQIVPEGGDFAAYLRNPVVGFQHFRTDPLPIGTTTQLQVDRHGIRASWRWIENDPLADRVRNAYGQGALRAASIGFLPLESERISTGGRRYVKWELTEWSLVAVPANRDAVRVLRSLDLWGDDARTVLRVRDDGVLHVRDEPINLGKMTSMQVRVAMRQGTRAALADVVAEKVRDQIDYMRGRVR